MKRFENYKALSLAAVILAVCSLTLGYAALTQTLNINIGGTVQSGTTTWNIHFENNGKAATKAGNAVLGTMDLKQTTITLSGVTLKTEGDSVTYSFNVVNDGELDAMISVLTPNTVTVTGGTTTEQAALKQAVEYTLKYADGIVVGLNDSLLASEEKEMLLTISLKDGTVLPTSNVSISNIGYTITYTQKTSASGGSGDDSTTLNGLTMNEHGFYFGVPYAGVVDGVESMYIFYESGNWQLFLANAGAYPEQTFTYSRLQATVGNNSITFSSDGTQAEIDGDTFTLDSNELALVKNEYDFYFSVPYSIGTGSNSYAAIFYRNGSFFTGQLQSFDAGMFTYEYGKIVGEGVTLSFNPEGTQFTDPTGVVFTLKWDS